MARKKNNFLIVARPRSRTMWLTTFLNAEGVVCQHDLTDLHTDPISFRDAVNVGPGICGVADTGAVLFLDQILAVMPCKLIIIDRPRQACARSLHDVGLSWDLSIFDVPMQRAAQIPGAVVVPYEALDSEEVIRALWDFITDNKEFPTRWYNHCRWAHVELSEEFFRDEQVRRMKQLYSSGHGWDTKKLFEEAYGHA